MAIVKNNFLFEGAPEIASGFTYNIRFVSFESEEYMNITMESKNESLNEGLNSFSSVSLSKDQILKIRDFLNEIYPLEKKEHEEDKTIQISLVLSVIGDKIYVLDKNDVPWIIQNDKIFPVNIG